MIVSFLEGTHVLLRPLVPSDANGAYPRWFNDPEVTAGNSHHVFPLTPEDAAAYIDRARTARDLLALAIVRKRDQAHVGNVSLQQINFVNRSAEFAIVIGDKTAWGKGYSKEAGGLLLDHGFTALNLNRIGCGTFESNIPMQKLALSLGMKEEGRRRKAAYKRGAYVDIIEYGVLRDEYLEQPSRRRK